MTDLTSLKWVTASARMSITDIMWEYSIELHGDGSEIEMYDMLEYRHPDTHIPLIRCVPISKEICSDHPTIKTTISGNSRACYLMNPIPIVERQSKITIDGAGSVVGYENPITYLDRIWNYTDYGMESVFQPIEPAAVLKKQYTYDAHPTADLFSEIASDYNRVYFEQIKQDSGGNPVHKFYLIDFEDIDTQLDLPAQLTLTPSDTCLIGDPGPKVSLNMSDSKNVVYVELCRKKDNAWFYAERKCQAVIDGDELPRVLVYRSSDLLPDPAADKFPTGTTPSSNFGCVTVIPGYESQSGGVSYGTPAENAACQQITDDKADALIEYLEMDVKQYELNLKITDPSLYQLALYQKVVLSGFTAIPSDVMRITAIEYTYQPVADGRDVVSVTLVPDSELQVARRFEEMQDEIKSNYTALKQSIERNVINNKIGVVKSLSPGNVYANIQLRSSGRTVQTRAWGERQLY